jgi:tripartite-type tricarboxylate transporter receptor subunit TctC
MKRGIFSAFFLIGFGLLANIAHATSHEFFKGKTIRLVVGTSAGGAQDEWARFIAPHLSRNISGGPDIVVQNMPGAGTVIAANYIYNIAKPDSLTIGLVNPAIYIDQLLGAKEVKFDWPKFSWIGSPEKIDQVFFGAHRHPLQDAGGYSQGYRTATVCSHGAFRRRLFFTQTP